jgi:hypothetical protein
MDYHYSDPPKGYTPYYDSSPTSPYNDDYVYYAPQQYESPQVKRHKRKYSYTATIPREWYSPAGYPSPKHYEEVPDYKSPPYKEVYVSTIKRDMKSKLRSYSISGGRQNHTTRKQEQPIYIQMALMMHISTASQSQRRGTQRSPALIRTFNQEQIYDEQAKRSRGRRSSTTPRTPQKPSKPSYSKPPPKATEEDAARAGISSGYSIQNWDLTELPIVLLGSVFDANSLGKWIYDWTVYHHGPSTSMADVADGLWLLLTKLAGKMKRAEECVPRIRSPDARLPRFTSPLHIPMAKVLPIMFAFCTPVSAHPIDADIAISEHWKPGASKFDWDAILTPDTVLCLITLMLEVICVVTVSYKARNDPCSTYGFFAILFGVVVILISDDSRIPMAVAGPTIAAGGYFCARYGLAQSRLDPVNGQRYASMMLLTGVFLDCAAAHTFGVDGLGKGGLVQWSLLTFWLSISLWPYLARVLDFSRNDLTLT